MSVTFFYVFWLLNLNIRFPPSPLDFAVLKVFIFTIEIEKWKQILKKQGLIDIAFCIENTLENTIIMNQSSLFREYNFLIFYC